MEAYEYEDENFNEDEDNSNANQNSKSKGILSKELQSFQNRVVTIGELITEESEGFLRGHGTFVEDGKMYSSVCGNVEMINKLISVRPLRSRYNAEIGDVVVGRVTEVLSGFWKVDIQGKQDAILQLSAINLPGGIQRRRTNEDKLNMRTLFIENDLISAEVQGIKGYSINLHARSLKYGKLGKGQFLKVPPSLVKRCKQHFYTFPFGTEIVLGTNGYIWISYSSSSSSNSDENDKYKISNTIFNTKPLSEEELEQKKIEPINAEAREKIARVRNSILALSKLFIPVHPSTINDVYESSKNIPAKDMLSEDVILIITEQAKERAASNAF